MHKYYIILGLTYPPAPSKDEIKLAFRKLAHIHHPDKLTGNVEKFKELLNAYEILMKDRSPTQEPFVQYQPSRYQPFGAQGSYSANSTARGNSLTYTIFDPTTNSWIVVRWR